MFIGDFEKAAAWSNDAVKGSKRFLDRVWNLAESASDSYDVTPANEAVIHKTIKKVTEDIDGHEDEHRHRRHDDHGERASTPTAAPGAT